MGHILKFARSAPEARDWRNDELAELYRVENSLLQAGVSVDTVRGLTDEGDPWFAFCGANGDVIVHIARYDGAYHIHAAALNGGLQGQSFAEITKKFIGRLPMQMSKGVTLHPSALFGLMVATLFFAIDHKPAEAATKTDAAHNAPTPPASLVNTLRHYVRTLASGNGEAPFASETEMAALTQLIAVAASLGGGAQALDVSASAHFAGSGDVGATAAGLPTIQAAADVFTAPSPSEVYADAPAGAGALTPSNPSPTAPSAPVAVTPAAVAPAISAALPVRAPAGAPPPAPVAPGSTVPTARGDSGDTVVVSHSGSLALVESLAAGFKIVVAGNAHVSLDLGLTDAKNATSGEATLALGGHASLDLNSLTALPAPASAALGNAPSLAPSAADPPKLELAVASVGGDANTITLGANVGSSVNLNIHVTGSQDLQLNESAANLGGVSVNSMQFAGALTIGVDLSDVSGGPTLIGQSSFVVSEHSSLALLNVHDSATVQFGISLASAIIDMSAGATTLDLQLTPSASGVSVTSLSASDVTGLTIESLGGAGAANAIEAFYGGALSTLAIVGDAPLAIGVFVMSATDAQAATVDASQFGASLQIDVTGLAVSLGPGAGLTLKLGAAGAQVTDLDASAALTIVGGGGADTIDLGAGATRVALVNPSAAQQVFIGGGTAPDRAIDASHLSAAAQAALDTQSLSGAAEAAATAAGVSGAHQAVLFNYGGGTYVFVDALGTHVFNAAVDAIVGLVGAHAPAEIAAQFHSI